MKDEVSVNLGIKYVKTNRGYVTITGQLFTFEEVEGKSREEIEELYTIKRETEPLYDYPYALTTGYARKRKAEYSITENEIEDVPVVRTKSIVATEQKIIVPFLFIIPFLAVIMSCYFTYTHQAKYLHPAVSVLFTVVIVVFNTIALSLITMFFRRKGRLNKLLAFLLSLFWLITMLYSISNMLDVMYDKAVSKNVVLEKEVTSINASAVLLKAKDEQIALKKEAIEKQEERINGIQKDIEYYDSIEWTTRAFELRQTKSKASTASSVLESELQTLLEEKNALIREAPEAAITEEKKEAKTFYTAVAGENAEKLEVYITMLPAIFFDFIAPFLMAIGIYLIEDRRKNFECSTGA